jgi:hypothetical protein
VEQTVQTEKWKATLDWYKQLMTVNGVAGVATAAFLTFAGRGTNIVGVPTIILAYSAIFVFLISVGLAVFAMFNVINYVEPERVPGFLSGLPNFLSPFYYFVLGLILFIGAVFLQFVVFAV